MLFFSEGRPASPPPLDNARFEARWPAGSGRPGRGAASLRGARSWRGEGRRAAREENPEKDDFPPPPPPVLPRQGQQDLDLGRGGRKGGGERFCVRLLAYTGPSPQPKHGVSAPNCAF